MKYFSQISTVGGRREYFGAVLEATLNKNEEHIHDYDDDYDYDDDDDDTYRSFRVPFNDFQ